MISNVRLAQSDDFIASTNILQIGHLFGRHDHEVKCDSIFQIGHVLGANAVVRI